MHGIDLRRSDHCDNFLIGGFVSRLEHGCCSQSSNEDGEEEHDW